MPQCIFNQTTGLFVRGAQNDAPAFDAATEVLVVLPSYPDPRTVRWNGATGVRAASGPELSVYDDAAASASAITDLDSLKVAKALALYLLDQLNVLRLAAGLPALTQVDLRNGVIAKYRAL